MIAKIYFYSIIICLTADIPVCYSFRLLQSRISNNTATYMVFIMRLTECNLRLLKIELL